MMSDTGRGSAPAPDLYCETPSVNLKEMVRMNTVGILLPQLAGSIRYVWNQEIAKSHAPTECCSLLRRVRCSVLKRVEWSKESKAVARYWCQTYTIQDMIMLPVVYPLFKIMVPNVYCL